VNVLWDESILGRPVPFANTPLDEKGKFFSPTHPGDKWTVLPVSMRESEKAAVVAHAKAQCLKTAEWVRNANSRLLAAEADCNTDNQPSLDI
jgi:hypothetical protein